MNDSLKQNQRAGEGSTLIQAGRDVNNINVTVDISHEPERQGHVVPLMPLVREITIPAKAIPIHLGTGEVLPVPTSHDSPGHLSFYGLLEHLSRVAFEPLPSRIVFPESDRPRSREEGARFLVELFQYALFRSIDLLQHSSTEYIKRSHRTATVPPEAVVYPSEEIAAIVGQNRFAQVGQEPVLWTGGWEVRVPKDTTILFAHQGGDSVIAPTYSIELSNPTLYLLQISSYVQTIYDHPLDGHPVTNWSTSVTTAYELMIKCYFEFKRKHRY